jgi:signal transduction histidine kinase
VDLQVSRINEDQFRANRFELISRLADDLAHEIKNPLNAIVINLELLKVRLHRGDAAAAGDRVGVIEEEVHRLHGLVDRLLQLLRPDRDEAMSLALDQVLDEVLPLVEAQVRLARNEFRVRADAAVYVPVRRDIFKFAMLNVLTAVHERLGEGGGTLALDCIVDDDVVRLVVAAEHDDGRSGGTSDVQERALEMAAQLLQPGRGSIEVAADRVTVVLPLSAGV